MLEKILHRYLSQEVCDKKNSYAKKDHSLKQGISLSLSAVIIDGQGRQ